MQQVQASPQALKAIRDRIIELERFSNRGFGVHCFQKARLVDIKAWNVDVDLVTGLSKAGKNAKVQLVHEIEIDDCELRRFIFFPLRKAFRLIISNTCCGSYDKQSRYASWRFPSFIAGRVSCVVS
jgi:hypothetical protein